MELSSFDRLHRALCLAKTKFGLSGSRTASQQDLLHCEQRSTEKIVWPLTRKLKPESYIQSDRLAQERCGVEKQSSTTSLSREKFFFVLIGGGRDYDLWM